MLFRLRNDVIAFPNPALAEDDGLLAIGGDLSAERLTLAYASGIFPWYSDDDPILWYSPPMRCVLFPDKINISKSMQRLFRKEVFNITVNKAFSSVIRSCAAIQRPGQDGTWINDDMQEAYIELNRKGIAKSIEIWKGDELAGGLYGVEINDIFCGESMFSAYPNASKAALIALCTQMNYRLIDCQIPNPHLMSMGAEMMDRAVYLQYLTL
ncbi:leucyl/phenylalanyl-tRNA--protein transferase [Taibaiella lutea]|uniref:Leucyl/phenylalanyl-tRNA--protein transferase n=1 Tax=Taibaiella lutea TaxID=2608001 RepID=A0A5M6CI48_9BACT|nr:leucyl/phenylalanyl-tRNA--protein transferase [Taibaiella lutea]KAA5534784.1 leucyl/phenylalanyl-tRNA--protein transferase [Taibaiella lutea]